MTLKQVIEKIQAICEAHSQIKSFYHNVYQSEWENDKKTKYPAAFLKDGGGTISTSAHVTTISFSLYLVDLVYIIKDTKSNELDVISDMLSVAQDLITQFNYPTNGLFLSADNTVTPHVEGDVESGGDMFAGVSVDFSIRIVFPQNICAVPTN